MFDCDEDHRLASWACGEGIGVRANQALTVFTGTVHV